MDTVTDLYRFAQLARITISDACNRSGSVTNKTVSEWKCKGRVPQHGKFLAVRDALIELADERGTLPLTDVDEARRMGMKELIGKMSK